MKILSQILIAILILNISFAQDCSDLEAQCNTDPNCSIFGNQASICTTNNPPYNNTYGCQYDNEDEQYPAFVDSCSYNCFQNASLNSNNTLFNNLTDCIQSQTISDSCPGQFENCYNTNANGFNCLNPLNSLQLCLMNFINLPGCAQANENNADTLYPAYQSQCIYSCYNNVTNSNNTNQVFQNLYSCELADSLQFPQSVCTSQFVNCLADASGLCVQYLNQATINVQASSNCTGSNSNSNAAFIQGCANSTYTSVNTTANPSPLYSNLTNCLSTFNSNSPSPTPTPSPSPTSGNSNTTSSSFAGLLSIFMIVLSFFSL